MSVGTIRIVGFGTAGAGKGGTSGCQAADFRMRLMQGKSSKQLVRVFCNDPLYFALSINDANALILRSLYTLVWLIALPFVLLRLVWRARRQPDYLRHIPERFGFYRTASTIR
jgi:hypothetical protein